MPPNPAGERTLRAAALGGDADAWAALFRSAHATVFRYALWRCGRRDLAEDVTAEAWLLAAKKLRAFDPNRGPFAGWVCGLAANAARNAVRRQLRERKRAAVAVPSETPNGPDPETVAVALAELPADYEAVLRAKYFDGQSVAEIATTTGRTPKAVESLLTRAREAFRTAFNRLGGNA